MIEDCNTTLQALDIATNRLNWYIGLTIFATAVSIIAIIISTRNNRTSLESINKNHTQQLKANHDWNRRSFTINFLNDLIKTIQETREKLNEETSKVSIRGDANNKLSFSDRFIRGDALTEEEVHNWICEWDDSKKEFVKEKSDGHDFKLTKNGDKIRILFIKLINTYETVGSAMKNGVLDEDVVKSLMKGPIVANYEFFITWIKHLRNKHKLKNAGKNFEDLYKLVNPSEEVSKRAKTEDL